MKKMLSSNVNSNEVATTTSLQPMGFTDILDTILSLYRHHCRLILGICAVYFVLTLGMDILTSILTLFFKDFGGGSITIVMNPFASWITLLVALFPTGALLFASAQAYLDNHITTGAAFKQVTRRFLSYLGSSLLLMIVIVVLAITIIGIPFAIYFGTRWSFYGQAVMIEETSATNALKRSRELVKGTWWRIFGIILAIFLIAFMIQTVLQFFLLFAFGFTETISGEEGLLEMFQRMFEPELTNWDRLAAYVIQSFLNHFVTSLILPLTSVGITLLYFDQRIRKEGFGTVDVISEVE